MIFMPPRHGKSELASRRFPAWYLGRNPEKQVIAASYNNELASDFGREVRNIVCSEEYGAVFGNRLSPDSRAVNRWHTDRGGHYMAAGIGTALTGRGGHVALVDDPIKDQTEADSQNSKDAIWKWYQTVLRTRLMPEGAIILVQTRWAEDDLAGRILETQGDQWEVLLLPALDGEEALWPEWYPAHVLKQLRDQMTPRHWNALYQQNPIPEEGSFFKRDWFEFYDDVPEGSFYYMASDYAVTDSETADWTEHGVVAIAPNADMYLVDWWSGQETADVWIDAGLDLVNQYAPLAWIGEGGQIRRAVEPFMARRMMERQTYCRLEWITRNRDKASMARSFQARASMGKVKLPRKQWAYDLMSQLIAFPAGKHDDKVDVCALFGLIVDGMVPGVDPAALVQEEAPTDMWGRYKRSGETWRTI